MMAQIHYFKINNPIPPNWTNDTIPRLLFPTGISDSDVPVAGATMRSMVVTGTERR
jgi:hypothetical protein